MDDPEFMASRPAQVRWLLITAFLFLLAGCSVNGETPEQRLDGAILNAASSGTGCAKADVNINHSEDVRRDGFDPQYSGDQYGAAYSEYDACAKRSSFAAQQARYYTLAAVAADMAAVRYAMIPNNDAFSNSLYLFAHIELRAASKHLAAADGTTRNMFGQLQRVINTPPTKQ